MDQVLHPYETQHTLKEIVKVFVEMGVDFVSTLINRFEPMQDVEELFRIEKGLYEKGMCYLKKREYFPRFFYVLGKKR
ncbi:MAG: hypothetical protein NC124_10465 [Clostridium sp.]|nr:hypothetical protein [Clostridium sp.]